MAVTAFYAGLFGILVIYLSFRVIDARRKQRISRGDGGDAMVALRRGLHANTLEYGLLLLLLLALAESLQAPGLLLHGIAVLFASGRAFYIASGRDDRENFKLRARGMKLTFASLALASALATIMAIAPEFSCCRLPL